jgi:2-methylcitrate dehydratase PrpD
LSSSDPVSTRDETLSTELARLASDIATQADTKVRNSATRSFFDFLGCVIGADCRGLEWPERGAARVAVLAHLLDQDDFHLESTTHPGGIIWSAVTTCAAETRASWNACIEAAVAGYEVMIRLAETFGSEHRQLWHATPVAGTVGAAAASGILLRCGPDALVDAIGHASAIASGSSQGQVERTGTRLVHRAFAAGAGVAAAARAAAGLVGIRGGLDRQRGAFAGVRTENIEACLGPRASTCLEETGFRLHPATGFAHAAIDAALRLGPLPATAIARVVVEIGPRSALAMASDPAPATDEDAWWSIQHAVATCLVRGTTQPLAVGLTDDSDVVRVCRSTTLTATDAGWSARVEVTTSDGRVLSAAADAPLGQAPNLATDAQLTEKFERLTNAGGQSILNALLAGDGELPFMSFVDRCLDRVAASAWTEIVNTMRAA